MATKLFVDMMSQPSRAVVWLARLAEIPHEVALVQIAKGEHFKLGDINPMKRVPVLQEADGWALPESHAILRYLCNKHPEQTVSLYPADIRKRARVDEVLDWHHTMLRRGAAPYVFNKVLGPRIGVEVNDADLKQSVSYLKKSLRVMDGWLTPGPFLCGDAVTIADLSLSSEVEQLQCLGAEAFAEQLEEYAAVRKWLDQMRGVPHYDDTFAVLHKVVKRLTAAKL